MKIYLQGFLFQKRFVTLICILLYTTFSILSQTVGVSGLITDSISGEPIEFATVRFEGTSVGTLTKENGSFSIRNSAGKTLLVISLMGYESKAVRVPLRSDTQLNVKLKREGVQLKEIVVKPKKEKYSKKDNPAVELIKKVIKHKYDYLPDNQDYYTDDEYERLIFALNDFKAGKGIFKNAKFLSKYADTSLIDNKPILPISVKETTSNVYFKKESKDTRRVVTAYKSEGLDQNMNTETIDAVVNEIFKDVDIRENNINLLFSDFVGPLSNTTSVNFYKWYIIDTVSIEQQKYINLGFVPFNTRDVGFIGNIYVKADSSYAVKRISFRVPSKINVRYLDNMLVTQEFKELSPNLWIPERFTMAVDMSVYGMGKIYVEKIRDFSNFTFNLPVDAIFQSSSPVIYLSDYKYRNNDFWKKNRPENLSKDLLTGNMMKELRQNKFIDVTIKTVDILSSGYIATNKDERKNKVDIGTPLTFYSYNQLEGNRFRLTASTNKNFNPHLYLYGYAAYGTRDEKMKYYGEATWAFNKKEYHKDEFPRNNLVIAYKYDVNTLGQRYLQAERDNILLSIGAKHYNNLTYNRMFELSYLHEYHNGFSFSVSGKNYNETPAGNLKFEYLHADNDTVSNVKPLKTTEVGLHLRWAQKEKFFQQRRKRRRMASSGFVFDLDHTMGIKNIFGSHYNYNKSFLSVEKEFWIAPFGRAGFTIRGEKVWGEAPFPLLLSANANSSITIQRGSFYMLRALEFINDSQLTWDISYESSGWLLNRIPIINLLKLKGVFGFRGFWGHLSKNNNPEYNHELMLFPENVYSMGKTPYMEYSIGLRNIFQFFRVDYVRRINYLGHPNIEKDGFRISFDASF